MQRTEILLAVDLIDGEVGITYMKVGNYPKVFILGLKQSIDCPFLLFTSDY
jgi:hypothetical protein